MISVAAIRMQQFGVQFYQAALTAKDIDKLVRFEVLNYGEQAQGSRGPEEAPLPEHGAKRHEMAKVQDDVSISSEIMILKS